MSSACGEWALAVASVMSSDGVAAFVVKKVFSNNVVSKFRHLRFSKS